MRTLAAAADPATVAWVSSASLEACVRSEGRPGTLFFVEHVTDLAPDGMCGFDLLLVDELELLLGRVPRTNDVDLLAERWGTRVIATTQAAAPTAPGGWATAAGAGAADQPE